MTTQLDAFQSALLTELREVVDGAGPRRAPLRRRRTAILAAAGAACAAGAASLPFLLGGSAAYAVTTSAGGDVDVRIDRPEDAAGLERALADVGVKADVTYLPFGMACAPGRFSTVGVGGSTDENKRVAVTTGTNGYRVHIDAGALDPDTTLVIWSAAWPKDESLVHGEVSEMAFAAGPVAPCRPIPNSELPD